MQLQYYYHVIKNAIPLEFCDRIIETGLGLPNNPATVQNDPKRKLRKSIVSWIPNDDEHSWIYNKIGSIILSTNFKHWGWQLQQVENMQFTRYEEEGHYTWHADSYRQAYDKDSRWPGMTRKISCTLLLSEPSDYEGGEFQIETQNAAPGDPARIENLSDAIGKGTLIIFPSHLFHRVTPVQSGVRQSLVAWYLGRPFI